MQRPVSNQSKRSQHPASWGGGGWTLTNTSNPSRCARDKAACTSNQCTPPPPNNSLTTFCLTGYPGTKEGGGTALCIPPKNAIPFRPPEPMPSNDLINCWYPWRGFTSSVKALEESICRHTRINVPLCLGKPHQQLHLPLPLYLIPTTVIRCKKINWKLINF